MLSFVLGSSHNHDSTPPTTGITPPSAVGSHAAAALQAAHAATAATRPPCRVACVDERTALGCGSAAP